MPWEASATVRISHGDGFRQSLKQATRAAHRRLDHHSLLGPLVRDGLSRAHYIAVLQALYAIHAPLNAAILAALPRFPPLASFVPSDFPGWLRMDCQYLGVPACFGCATASLPAPPTIACLADLLGILYVTEGSTLGGQVIARCLREGPGYAASSGARMFNSHGAETEQRWLSFIDLAERTCPSAQIEQASRTAVSLFDYFAAGLDGMGGRRQ